MDVNAYRVGSTVYLPVGVDGALLCIGDVHASMGDGELTGGGLDISAVVTVATKIHRNVGWEHVVIETTDGWCTVGNAPNLMDAIKRATSDMTTLLAHGFNMSREEAFILIGSKAKVSTEAGASFSAFGGDLRGKTLHAKKNAVFVQTWRGGNWSKSDPDSILILIFREIETGTELELVHANVPDHDAEDVKNGWKEYYWKPWRAYIGSRSGI